MQSYCGCPVSYVANYYMQNCVYLYLVPLLLYGIGNLLAYVAALFVARVCNLSVLVAQMRGKETINLLVVGSICPELILSFFLSLWSYIFDR